MKQQTQLVVVDMDLINNLRLSGRRAEARAMIDAFVEQTKREKVQVLNEIKRRDAHIKAQLQMCVAQGCKDECIRKSVYCARHKEMRQANTARSDKWKKKLSSMETTIKQ